MAEHLKQLLIDEYENDRDSPETIEWLTYPLWLVSGGIIYGRYEPRGFHFAVKMAEDFAEEYEEVAFIMDTRVLVDGEPKVAYDTINGHWDWIPQGTEE